MKLLKINVNAFAFGVTIGSTLYLLVIAAGLQLTPPTAKNILSIMFMSGLIGLLSQIFDIDSLPYLTALVLHFLCTFMLVSMMMAYNGWLFNEWQLPKFWFGYFLEYLIIYGLAWGIIELMISTKVKRINQALKKRNQMK